MKPTVLSLLLIITCLCCKTDVPPGASPRIKPITGAWKLTDIQVRDGQTKTWQPVPDHRENDIEVLPNGVILDYKQEGVCCHPKELNINGSIELVNAIIRNVDSSNCSSSCVQCQVWTISYIEGEMTITGCVDTDVKRYRRKGATCH